MKMCLRDKILCIYGKHNCKIIQKMNMVSLKCQEVSRYKLTEIFNHYLNYYLSTISRSSLVKKQGTPWKVYHRYFNSYKCFNTKCCENA